MSITPNQSPQPTGKYLTPCRTFGLKRKSMTKSSPLSGCPQIGPEDYLNSSEKRMKSTSPCDSSVLSRSILNKSPLRSKAFDNRLNIVQHSLSAMNSCNDTTPKRKPTMYKKLMRTDACQEKNSNGGLQVITSEMLRDLILTINRKTARLDSLMTNQEYSKKHDLEDLQKSTEKWKSVCKDALNMLLSEIQQRSHNCSMLTIMAEHHISAELLDFDTETLEFV